MMQQTQKQTGRRAAVQSMVFTGMLSAVSIVLYYLEFPLFSQYLKIDFSDLPAAVAGIFFGPGAGVAVELIKNLAHLPSTTTMGFGDLMNFIVGTALVLPLSLVARRMHRAGRPQVACVGFGGAAGLCAMVAAGVLGNYLIAPPYFQAVLHVTLTGPALWAAIGSATLLNLLKSVFTTLLLFPVLPAVSRFRGR